MVKIDVSPLKWEYDCARIIDERSSVICKSKGIFGFDVTIYKVGNKYEASGNYCSYDEQHYDLECLKYKINDLYLEKIEKYNGSIV